MGFLRKYTHLPLASAEKNQSNTWIWDDINQKIRPNVFVLEYYTNISILWTIFFRFSVNTMIYLQEIREDRQNVRRDYRS